MSDNTLHIAFVGGGTSGHIGKLLAVMGAVRALARDEGKAVKFSYIGLRNDLDSPLIAASPFEFEKHAISSGKLNRHLTLSQGVEFWRLAKGMLQAGPLLKRLRPDIVFANGGFVTVPIALAAGRLKIPLVTHETDVIPGLANRIAAKSASLVCTSYPTGAYTGLPQKKMKMVGQPVRPEFYSVDGSAALTLEGREVGSPLISVIGGSQGARRVNELVSDVWEELLGKACVVHIAGQKECESLKAKSAELPAELRAKLWVLPFVGPELPLAFKKSDIVISRSGGTIAELAAVGAATILVPLSTSAQGHQLANAAMLERAGAAVVVNETSATSAELGRLVLGLLKDRKKRQELSENISRFDRPNAARDIAKILLSGSISA